MACSPKPHKRKAILAIIVCLVLMIGGILYALADRYLIEHVEALPDSSQTAAAFATTKSPDGIKAAITGDSYISSDIAVRIEKKESGTGKNKVIYFVADVQLDNMTCLRSAFAKGKFGRNIVEPTSTIAAANAAIFAVNGDYYGFRANGIEIRNGILYRNSAARTGAAIYANGNMKLYDEAQASAASLLKDGALQTLSFGPALVADGVAATNFGKLQVDNNLGNAATISDINPRTGIGLVSPGHFIFIVVDGRKAGYSRGVTLAEFAQMFAAQDCCVAYNLDGGGSSTMYFLGNVVNEPGGETAERPVSDILYLAE